MKPRLKENPRDWQKFSTVTLLVLGLVTTAAWRRGWVSEAAWAGLLTAAGAAIVCAWIYPRPFRGFYRVGMTLSFYVGQVMGKVLLTLIFLLAVTPLGILLRLSGKDLLKLRRKRDATSYWQDCRPRGPFDRQF